MDEFILDEKGIVHCISAARYGNPFSTIILFTQGNRMLFIARRPFIDPSGS